MLAESKLGILSQYENSTQLVKLLKSLNIETNVSAMIQDFMDKVVNIKTAVGIGLDWWGNIVGVGRSINLDYLGLDFPIRMGDDLYRLAIQLKAFSNISNTSLYSLNYATKLLLGSEVDAYWMKTPIITDDVKTGEKPMSLTFVLNTPDVDPYAIALLVSPEIAPIPAAVDVIVSETPSGEVFGFSGSGLWGFDTKPFFK